MTTAGLFRIGIQVPKGSGYNNGSVGVTAGWHFYDRSLGWDILYPYVRDVMPECVSTQAIARWSFQGLESRGINQEKNAWELVPEGGMPLITSPEGVEMDTFNCPFVQIRWNAEGGGVSGAYIEWQRKGDKDWSASQRMNYSPDWIPGRSDGPAGQATGMFHSIIPLYRHPEWDRRNSTDPFLPVFHECIAENFLY